MKQDYSVQREWNALVSLKRQQSMPAKTLGAERHGYQHFLGTFPHLVRGGGGLLEGGLWGYIQFSAFCDRDGYTITLVECNEVDFKDKIEHPYDWPWLNPYSSQLHCALVQFHRPIST